MFTGIIQQMGNVCYLTESHSEVEIETHYSDLTMGESVALNGVCLTVTKISDTKALFFISPETLDKTNLRFLNLHSSVNLERALQMNDRLSGHWVQGHVDACSEVLEIKHFEQTWFLKIGISSTLLPYCVKKGSITINGVSLTINGINKNSKNQIFIEIALIPHTWQHTNLSQLKVGNLVNIEVDILAKYVESLLKKSEILDSERND